MSVPISVIERHNPLEPDEPRKFYGTTQVSDNVDFDELCELASDGCTITQADISASFYAVVKAANKCLKKGQIIRLGNLGSMQIVVHSRGAETREEFNASYIKRGKIRFIPGKALKETTKVLTYKLLPRSKEEEEGPKTDANGNIDL